MHSSSSTGNLPVSKQLSSTPASIHTTSAIQTLAPKGTMQVNLESERNVVSKDIISAPLPESSSDVVSSTMEEDVDSERYVEVSNANRHDVRRRKTKNKVNTTCV